MVPTFEESCIPYRAELHAHARRYTSHGADDLVQDTYVSALAAWDRFDHSRPGTNVRAWLYRILIHTGIKSYRRDLTVLRYVDAVTCLYYGTPDDTPDNALGVEVSAALDGLHPVYRDVLERVALRGESYRAVAAALDVPIGTVMSRLHRARQYMAGRLAAYASREYGIGNN